VTARENKIRLGLIGCGRATETRHLPALRHVKAAEVVALADINPGPLHNLADRFRIKQRYEDYRRLLHDQSIDAVAVCVPAQSHTEVALAAMKAGKHVFIEKPLAVGLDDSERIIELAAKLPQLKVMVGLNMRWHRLIRKARAIIREGTLGDVELVRSVLTSYHATVPDWGSRRSSGGGVLFELAVHHVDLWRYLVGCEVEEVYAESRSAYWEDDYAAVSARMTDGTRVSSVFSHRGSEVNEIEIYGTKGGLSISCYEFDGLEHIAPGRYPGDPRARLSKAFHSLRELPLGLRTLVSGGDFFASYGAEWQHFLNAIQRNAAPTEGTLIDGQRSLEVVLAAIASSCLRKPVKRSAAPRSVFALESHSFL
jgi:myo-inositol 2-dehydrogenase / D-chiro-inositol 1-dehydrogenase